MVCFCGPQFLFFLRPLVARSTVYSPTRPPHTRARPPAASDADWFNNDTLPFVISFTPSGKGFKWNWMASTGQEQVNTLGSAGPLVRDGALNELELYIASYQGAVALTPGKTCVAPEGLECNNNGECNCVTGTCKCNTDDVCKLGPFCGNTCNAKGVSTGVCTKKTAGNATTAVCACSACYGGATCSEYTCSAASKSFFATPAGAAAVGVPVGLTLAAGLYAVMWRAMNPKKPWGKMLGRERGGDEATTLLGPSA